MTRDEVLQRLLPVFRERGLEGATINEIAKAAGLGKASLYHHFPAGKDEMLRVIIDHVVEELDRTVFAPLAEEAPAKRRLTALLAALAGYVGDGERNCLLGTLAVGTARERIAERVRPRLDAWTAAVERAYAQAGLSPKRANRAARDLLIRFYGALVVSRLIGDTAPFLFTLRRLAREVEKL